MLGFISFLENGSLTVLTVLQGTFRLCWKTVLIVNTMRGQLHIAGRKVRDVAKHPMIPQDRFFTKQQLSCHNSTVSLLRKLVLDLLSKYFICSVSDSMGWYLWGFASV